MKRVRKLKPKTNHGRIYSAAFCLAAILVTTLQVGCSSTGAFPAAQQVYRPPMPAMGYSANYPNQGWGGQPGLFQTQPYGAGYGQSQFNPANGQSGFSGGNPAGFQFQPGAGYQNLQSNWQHLQSNFNQNFNPFGFAKTTC